MECILLSVFGNGAFRIKRKYPCFYYGRRTRIRPYAATIKKWTFLVYNEFIKRAVGKKPGDSVHVTLEKDMRKREFLIPAYIEDYLTDAGIIEMFLKQPDYAKREQVNFIELAKKEETKINRINALIGRLGKETD